MDTQYPITPRQAFFNDPGIKPVSIRAFGELCYVIMQKDKRQQKLHDTAERFRYLGTSSTPVSIQSVTYWLIVHVHM